MTTPMSAPNTTPVTVNGTGLVPNITVPEVAGIRFEIQGV